MDIKEIRAKYPQYADIPDDKLLKGLHAKFYADMPYEEFSAKVGAGATAAEQPKAPELPETMQIVRDLTAGGLRGAASIGSTILAPFKAAWDGTGQTGAKSERGRILKDVDEGLGYLGADQESMSYGAGKLGTEVAGTLGAGGAVARGMQAVPALAKFAPLVESGGFNLGQAGTGNAAANALFRAGGGAVQGGAAAGLVDPQSAGMGAAIGGVAPAAIRGAGMAGDLVSKGLDSASRKLMNSALKPTIEMHRKGEAARAVQTMLDEGINATASGVDTLKTRIGGLNDEIAAKIKDSDALVDRDKVISAVSGARDKFISQVDPASDLAAIDDVVSGFKAHPYFQAIEARGQPLRETLDRARRGKEQALQAAGKLKTFAAQQGQLAGGDVVDLATRQPQNQLYFNVGEMGGRAMSPQAYPVGGMPRIPSRYTSNIDRVPEGESGYLDAMAAYTARRADEDAARAALAQWEATSGKIPVTMAQKLKQGTYKALKGKYGEVGSASTEAQKALARGLKEGVADAVPGVAALNKRESALLEALTVAERRALMDANKNPVGLGPLAPNKAMLLAFLADRSAALKSLAARGAYQASQGLLSPALPNLVGQYGLLGAPSVLATSP